MPKVYIIDQSTASFDLPPELSKICEKEECWYQKMIPEDLIGLVSDWPENYADNLKNGTDIVREKHTDVSGKETVWVKWDSREVRHYIDITPSQIFDLIEHFGGAVSIFKTTSPNCSHLYKSPDLEVFFGEPSIGDAWVMEIHDNLEQQLRDSSLA